MPENMLTPTTEKIKMTSITREPTLAMDGEIIIIESTRTESYRLALISLRTLMILSAFMIFRYFKKLGFAFSIPSAIMDISATITIMKSNLFHLFAK